MKYVPISELPKLKEQITVSNPPVEINNATSTQDESKSMQDESKSVQKPDYLTLIFESMRDFEGKPGDHNYRANNPLNCRCSRVGYLPKYGDVKCVNNFAVFPTWELGCEYGRNLILTKARRHPDWNLVNFIGDPVEGWAPASDNNPVQSYASFIGKRMGVNPFLWKIGSLLV